MIKLKHVDEGEEIYSVSGQIEFLIFYDRIKYLVEFYNFTRVSYNSLLDQKFHDLNQLKSSLDSLTNMAYENNGHEVYFSKHEIISVYNEDIYSVRTHFLEFQKMTLIIVLYSEVEKLIDNLIDTSVSASKFQAVNQKIKMLSDTIELNNDEFTSLQTAIDELRKIRNKLIHSYDYWDDTITLNGSASKGLEQIDDCYLESLISRIIESILRFEDEYNTFKEHKRN